MVKSGHKNAVVEKILDAFPNVTSIKQNINDSHSNVIMGRQSIIPLWYWNNRAIYGTTCKTYTVLK